MPIDLSSYTQSNKYTLPSDGYIQARANSTLLTIMVAIEGKNNDSPTFYLSADWQTDRFATNSIYVKKGMHVYMISQNGGAAFYPISQNYYLADANARLYVPLDPNITESPDANGIHTAIGFSDDVHNAKK